MNLTDCSSVPVSKNVFQVDGLVKDWKSDLEFGRWYFAHMSWEEFSGPYMTEAIADLHFQNYLREQRACPSCEE